MAIHRPLRPDQRTLAISELYAEDYEAIHTVLTQSPFAGTYAIRIRERGEREWLPVDSPEDLHDNSLKLSGIRFELMNGGDETYNQENELEALVVHLDAQSAYIVNPFKDVLHSGIAQQVVDLVQARRRHWKRFVISSGAEKGSFYTLSMAVTGILTAIIGISLPMLNGNGGGPATGFVAQPWFWMTMCGTIIMCLVAWCTLCATAHTRLHTLTRAESPKFVERNRDNIVISAVSTGTGFLLGVVATLLIS